MQSTANKHLLIETLSWRWKPNS